MPSASSTQASTAWRSCGSTPSCTDQVRTFRLFRWKDMPGALLPDDPATPAPADWYSVEEMKSPAVEQVPLGRAGAGRSENRACAGVAPHSPGVRGPEDRNGRRNHDEIRFWADYVRPGRHRPTSTTTRDATALRPGSPFVVLGDQNSDPFDGDSMPGAIQQLTEHPGSSTRCRTRRERSKRPGCRAVRTPPTAATLATTPPTSTMSPLPVTCGPTTSCLRSSCVPSTPEFSGRCAPTRWRG